MHPTQRNLLAAGLLGALAALNVGLAGAADLTVSAPVVSSRALVERVVTPGQECATEVQRCRTVDGVTEIVRGYEVVYRHAGRDVVVQLPYDPGRTVRVAVGILQ